MGGTTQSRSIFISYSSKDHDCVVPVVDELARRGQRPWFAPNDLRPFDSALSQRIAEAIAGSRITVAFLTDNYLRSDACMWEMLATLKSGGLDSLFLVAAPDLRTDISVLRENVQFQLPHEAATCRALADEALARLDEACPPSPSAHPRWWRVDALDPTEGTSQSRTGEFAGRFTERVRLLSAFTPHLGERSSANRTFDRAQIVGLGGQGKSLLALQFARDFQGRYSAIARFDAGGDRMGGRVDDETEVLESLLGQIRAWSLNEASALGRDLVLPERRSRDEWKRTREAVARLVAAAEGRVLWIVDDLPAGLPGPAVELLMCPGGGKTIVTTRQHTYDGHFHGSTLHLAPMDADEAVYILAGGSRELMQRERDDLIRIAEAVGGHALALAVLAPRVRAWPASGILARIQGQPAAAITQLEDAASQVGGLPEGHAASIMATLQMSITSLSRQPARTILRLSSLWPTAQPMPFDLLEAVVGADALDGAQELITASLADRVHSDHLQVHALVSGVTAHLCESGLLPMSDPDPDDLALRMAAARWMRPRLEPKDVWDAAEAGRTTWHLLEPVAAELDVPDRAVASAALLAMARLPMRHKPADVTGPALVDYLREPLGWAEQAQHLSAGPTEPEILDASRSVAMQGLLRLSQADTEPHAPRRVALASRGCDLLDETIRMRLSLAGDDATTPDDKELIRAHFNKGRGGIILARAVHAAGDVERVGPALDGAEAGYAHARAGREALLADPDAEILPAMLEDLASCHRGLAIVACTRVLYEPRLGRARRNGLLDEAAAALSAARRLTAQARASRPELPDGVSSADMTKDLEVSARLDLTRWGVRAAPPAGGALDPESLRESLRPAVEPLTARQAADGLVPWGPADPVGLGAGRPPGFIDLARLQVHESRGGRGVTARSVLAGFFDTDFPALMRTLREEDGDDGR